MLSLVINNLGGLEGGGQDAVASPLSEFFSCCYGNWPRDAGGSVCWPSPQLFLFTWLARGGPVRVLGEPDAAQLDSATSW